MSEQNVELHRRLIEAFNAHDIEQLVAHSYPQGELQTSFTAVGGGIYHGHDGVRSWFRDNQDAWGDEFRVETEALFDLGEYTLGFIVMHGRGRDGVEVAMPAAQVARWRDDLCVFCKMYAHRRHALRDLRVSENALEPIAR